MRSTKSTFGLVGIFAAALLLANLPVASQAAENSQNSAAEKQAKGMQLIGTLLKGTGAGGMPLPEKFTQYTVKHLFGDVWQGDDLSLQDRSFITCVTLIALNREAEMRLHFVGAKNVGVPRAKLEAAITHIVHYAGWPVGMTAFKVLNDVWPVDKEGNEK
jgi:alkylhydroperoxidase/carboxymuconolactone decarboxylase family protein YurZ